MASVLCGQPSKSGAVQVDLKGIEPDRAACGCVEEHGCLSGVQAVHSTDFPLARRDLPNQRAAGRIVVEVAPAASLAEPQKRPVFQPHGIHARVLPPFNPGLAGFLQKRGDGTGHDIGSIQIEPRLLPILYLIGEAAAIRRPADTDDEEVGISGGVDPEGFAAGQRGDAEPGDRVWISGLRVVQAINFGMIRNVIREGVLGHRPLIELNKGKAG